MTKTLKKVLSAVGMILLLSAVTLSTMECAGGAGGGKPASGGSGGGGSDNDSSPGTD
jgi:hypothetical protein